MLDKLQKGLNTKKTADITKSLTDAGILPTEHEEQTAFVSYFRKSFPTVRIIAIPNGGVRNKITALRLKCEGVSPGVPDLFIPEWFLFIEMKRRKGGTVSAEQKDWLEYLKTCGYKTVVAKGMDEAIKEAMARKEEIAKWLCYQQGGTE